MVFEMSCRMLTAREGIVVTTSASSGLSAGQLSAAATYLFWLSLFLHRCSIDVARAEQLRHSIRDS